MKRVVMFSGGIGSWAAARRVADEHGTADMTLLFADTLIEDLDLYRFLDQAAANIGAPLVRLCDGRTPFQVFRDERFFGNSRVDPCSKILKRKLLDKWRNEHCSPADTVIYLGLDWSEKHRLNRLLERVKTWRYEAPLADRPTISKAGMLKWAESYGIEPPALYGLGFPHNNCGGACVKAGKAHWRHLLRTLPEVFAKWEHEEREFIAWIGKKTTILRNMNGSPLTLEEFRIREERQAVLVRDDSEEEWGGCGCAIE